MGRFDIFHNYGLSEPVMDQVRELFDPSDFDAVTALLREYGAAPHHREVERVHLGILQICKEDIGEVRKLVDLAKKDYRDLIVAAEYELKNGKLVKKHTP